MEKVGEIIITVSRDEAGVVHSTHQFKNIGDALALIILADILRDIIKHAMAHFVDESSHTKPGF